MARSIPLETAAKVLRALVLEHTDEQEKAALLLGADAVEQRIAATRTSAGVARRLAHGRGRGGRHVFRLVTSRGEFEVLGEDGPTKSPWFHGFSRERISRNDLPALAPGEMPTAVVACGTHEGVFGAVVMALRTGRLVVLDEHAGSDAWRPAEIIDRALRLCGLTFHEVDAIACVDGVDAGIQLGLELARGGVDRVPSIRGDVPPGGLTAGLMIINRYLAADALRVRGSARVLDALKQFDGRTESAHILLVRLLARGAWLLEQVQAASLPPAQLGRREIRVLGDEVAERAATRSSDVRPGVSDGASGDPGVTDEIRSMPRADLERAFEQLSQEQDRVMPAVLDLLNYVEDVLHRLDARTALLALALADAVSPDSARRIRQAARG